MRILIVDDHVLFREGLLSLLDGQPDTHVIGQTGSVQEATALAIELKPDLILMDFGLPDGTGLDATKAILAIRPETKIVFLTMHEDDERLFEAIRTGAKGYLLKNVHVNTLLTFLRGVDRGEAALTPTMTGRVLNEFARLADLPKQDSPEFESLSTRELQVLKLLKKGATNREIAEQLFISENTVKNHVRSILTKLGLHNRRQAANYFGSKV